MATMFFFDPSKAEDVSTVQLKEGPHKARIVDVKHTEAQSGNGTFLEISLDIMGIVLKDRMTTAHINPTAVKMGLGKLKKLYAACNLGAAPVEKLLGKEVTTILAQKQNEQNGKKYFEPVDYVVPKVAQQVPNGYMPSGTYTNDENPPF